MHCRNSTSCVQPPAIHQQEAFNIFSRPCNPDLLTKIEVTGCRNARVLSLQDAPIPESWGVAQVSGRAQQILRLVNLFLPLENANHQEAQRPCHFQAQTPPA